MHRYPFGRPITPRPPSADGPRPVFVLGAYPSALHVEWTPPTPYRRVRAIPIDDEPTPFWDGADQEQRVRARRGAVGFKAAWGTIRAVPRFNGPSGQKLREMLFIPLAIASSDVWITDALDTYCASTGVAERVADTYARWAASVGAPSATLPPHPSEEEIVRGALRDHRSRLERELDAASPETIVTLGNAALRVIREIVGDDGPSTLTVDGYGSERTVRRNARTIRWLPLAHPAAPFRYQVAHAAWVTRQSERPT